MAVIEVATCFVKLSIPSMATVQLVSTADSRMERLCVLLTTFNSRHCIALYVPYPAVVDVCGLSKELPSDNSHTKTNSEKNSSHSI